MLGLALSALATGAANAQEDFLNQTKSSNVPDSNPAQRRKVYIPIQTNPTDMKLIAVGTIKEIIKSTMVKFEDGKVFTLINVRIPFLYDDKALEHLQKNYVGKKVGVYQNDTPGVSLSDKQQNLTGHIVTEDNVWMQADLVLKGLAWADSTERNRDLVIKLYQYEGLARANKSGFWTSAAFGLKRGDQLEQDYNTFQVVEDVVKTVKPMGNMFYFNFGDNPARDFTVIMHESIGANFRSPEGYAFKPTRWVNQRIRVRGWITKNSGPMITITHPEQIEFVGLESRPRAKNDK